MDQRGEFEGAFIAMCEEYSIDARVAGAHAPWQHGLAERHGGAFWNDLQQNGGAVWLLKEESE